MREKRTSPKRRKYNHLGLVISSSYLVVTLVLKGFAYRSFISNLEEQNITYQQIDIRPAPFSTVLWTANIDAGNSYLVGNYSFFDSKPIDFEPYSKNHNLLGEFANNNKVRRLMKISEGWYTISKTNDKLFFNDLRFGLMSLDDRSEERRVGKEC